MTDQEKDLARLAAWDKYQVARTDLLAHKSKLLQWRETFSALGHKMLCDLPELRDIDGVGLHVDFWPVRLIILGLLLLQLPRLGGGQWRNQQSHQQ